MSKTFEAILGQKRGVFGGSGFCAKTGNSFEVQRNGKTKQSKCKMLHVSFTFKRDYTLGLFFNIILR